MRLPTPSLPVSAHGTSACLAAPRPLPPAQGRRTLNRCTAIAAAAVLFAAAPSAAVAATPLGFTLINVDATAQSRLELSATAQFLGATLTAAPQFAPGGLNGAGSQSTLYNDTGNGSVLQTAVTQQSLSFVDGGGAIARHASGTFGNALAIAPGVGGASGTAPASYGVGFSAPQNIALPPIDLAPIGVPLVLNLGTLTAIDAKVALRGVVVDVVGGAIPLSLYTANPSQSFDAGLLQFGLSGSADLLLGATARQDSFLDYLAAGVALSALQQALAGQGVNLSIVNNGLGALSYTIGFGLSTELPPTLSANTAAGPGTLAQVGDQLRLSVPVQFEWLPSTPVDFLFSAQYGLGGTLIGQVPFVVVEVPEPATWLTGLLGLAVIGGAVGRARRASPGA